MGQFWMYWVIGTIGIVCTLLPAKASFFRETDCQSECLALTWIALAFLGKCPALNSGVSLALCVVVACWPRSCLAKTTPILNSALSRPFVSAWVKSAATLHKSHKILYLNLNIQLNHVWHGKSINALHTNGSVWTKTDRILGCSLGYLLLAKLQFPNHLPTVVAHLVWISMSGRVSSSRWCM